MKIATLLILFISLIVTSCMNTDDFPSTPQIKFVDLKFLEIGNNDNADTLKVTVSFEDSEGDLGLGGNEKNQPFNLQRYFSNKTGEEINFSDGPIQAEDIMTYKDRAIIDSLPPFTDPFTCTRWTTTPELFDDQGERFDDTVYFQFNPRHYNFFVKYLVKENGEFTEFNFREQFDCSITFDGRFPLINQNSTNNNPKEGVITYNMQSRFFLAFFENQTLKLEIRIVDRSGQYSNTITTEPFTLRGIQAN